MARKSKRKHEEEDEFHFSASESDGDDFFSTRPGFETLYSMEEMKKRHEKAGIEIPDSDDEGVRCFGQDIPVRRKKMRRRALDEEEQRKGRKEARRNKGRRKTEEKKGAAAVFNLDDSDDELVELVSGKDVMKEDEACRRAAELLERNRKIIQGDWSGDEKSNDSDGDRDDDVVLVSEEKADKVKADKVKADKEEDGARENHLLRNSRPSGGKPIFLKLRCAEHSATMKVMDNRPLSDALKAFCQTYHLEYSSARMEIDGEIVGEDATPVDYDLEDRSIIDIFTK